MRLQFFFGTLHSSIALFVPHKSLEGKGGILSPTWWSQSHGQVPLPRWSDTAMDAHIPATPLRMYVCMYVHTYIIVNGRESAVAPVTLQGLAAQATNSLCRSDQ